MYNMHIMFMEPQNLGSKHMLFINVVTGKLPKKLCRNHAAFLSFLKLLLSVALVWLWQGYWFVGRQHYTTLTRHIPLPNMGRDGQCWAHNDNVISLAWHDLDIGDAPSCQYQISRTWCCTRSKLVLWLLKHFLYPEQRWRHLKLWLTKTLFRLHTKHRTLRRCFYKFLFIECEDIHCELVDFDEEVYLYSSSTWGGSYLVTLTSRASIN